MTPYSPFVGSCDDEKPGLPEGQGQDRQAAADRFSTVRAISFCCAASYFQPVRYCSIAAIHATDSHPGASGSGTSAMGAALARRLVPRADRDSLYWLPTDPPFTTPRPSQAR
jgi:hypothetical protein